MADLPARIKHMQKLHGDAIGSATTTTQYNSHIQSSCQNAHPNNDTWKAFGKDNQAGRLLAKLYGGQYKPQVQYPTMKKKRAGPMHNSGWHPTGTAKADPRRKHVDKVRLRRSEATTA